MEIRIYQDMMTCQSHIAIFKKVNGDEYICKPFVLEFEEFKQGYEVEPALKLDRQLANEFLQELSRSLNDSGYKNDNSEPALAELKATIKHLEDMRDLVFKNGKR